MPPYREDQDSSPVASEHWRIDVAEPFEVQDWCERFECTEHALREAVAALGGSANVIARHFGKSLPGHAACSQQPRAVATQSRSE